MSESKKALGQRIAEIRRRHFGPRGKSILAERLGVSAEDVTRFERGQVPPGELMVSLCELTGEDLQWLLTGVASRGTVVISQARGRHQQLLARLADALESRPELAGPIESFVDLLLHDPQAAQDLPALPGAGPLGLIPIFEPDADLARLPSSDDPRTLDRFRRSAERFQSEQAMLLEPEEPEAAPRTVALVRLSDDIEDGSARVCVQSEALAEAFPGLFGLWIRDDSMNPNFVSGEIVLAVPGRQNQLGAPVVLSVGQSPRLVCRCWLGTDDEQNIQLGRLCDGGTELYPPSEVHWTSAVQFHVKPAA
jgi:transcriptional regulator with XRE-family HTH domain